MRTLRALLAALALTVMLGACSSTETPTNEPTQILIPATDTPIPSPPPATATSLPALPGPEDIAMATPTANSETVSGEVHAASPTLDDPVADDLVALAQRRVAQELNLPTRRIRVVEVTFYSWIDSSLGCPLPGESYAQVTADGYRIVLSAGDKEYIFHTDFDRVLPCDAANEQLPLKPGS